MSAWDSADLASKFLTYLGRGTGGVMSADELWTEARVYQWLADAQENVYSDFAPMCPHAFMSAPSLCTTADNGVTYTFAGGAYPFGHAEVYAQESGGRELFASTYGALGSDFVIQGATIRSPGNRPRTYASGPYARFVAMPTPISASQEPSIQPAAARELILFKALINAADVSNGVLDNAPWLQRYADARKRWIMVWQTQFSTQQSAGRGNTVNAWWLALDAMNGVE